MLFRVEEVPADPVELVPPALEPDKAGSIVVDDVELEVEPGIDWLLVEP